MKEVECSYCGAPIVKPTGHYNRTMSQSGRFFCNRSCFFKSRRKNRTEEEKKALKREYDIKYREQNITKLKAKRSEWHKQHYAAHPEHYRAYRQSRQQWHNEYCRQPQYRLYKKIYDRSYRCRKQFGEYAEAASLLLDLENEVRSRISKYDSMLQRGVLNKALRRARNENAKRSYS